MLGSYRYESIQIGCYCASAVYRIMTVIHLVAKTTKTCSHHHSLGEMNYVFGHRTDNKKQINAIHMDFVWRLIA